MHNSDVLPEFVRDINFSFKELESLTSLCFESSHYLENFPQVFKENNRDLLFFFKYNGQAASFCSLYPTYFQLENQKLNSYCIGSVCTHPKFRKKGFAKKALLQAEKKAKDNFADFLYLFSDYKNVYTELNYVPAGRTYLAQISSKISSPLYQNNLKRFNFEYLKKIKNMNLNDIEIVYKDNLKELSDNEKTLLWQFIVFHSSNSESIFSYLEFCDTMYIKNMQLYYMTINNCLCALGFVNKGDDFQNVIHSIYYKNIESIFILLNRIIERNKENELMLFPGSHVDDFIDSFEFQIIPSLFLKSINENRITTQKLQQICLKNDIFVGSLQGT